MPYPAFGTGGGGGGFLVVSTRSDNNLPAVFADISARNAYTSTTEGTADAARINVTSQSLAMEVFAIGTVSGGDVTSISAAFIRLNGAWVSVATNLVGTAGTDGADGTDGMANIPNVDNNRLVMVVDGALVAASLVDGDDGVVNEKGAIHPGSFLRLSNIQLTSDGFSAIGTDMTSGASFDPPGRPSTEAEGSGTLAVAKRDVVASVQFQPRNDELLTGAEIGTSIRELLTATVFEWRTPVEASAAGLFYIVIHLGTDATGPVYWQSHSPFQIANNDVFSLNGGNRIHDARITNTAANRSTPVSMLAGVDYFVRFIAPTGTFAFGGTTITQADVDDTSNLFTTLGQPAPAFETTFQTFILERVIVEGDVNALDRRSTSLTIDANNVDQYRPMGMVEFDNSDGNVDLVLADDVFTIGDQLVVKHYTNDGNPSGVRMEQQGTGGRIEGESDIILAMDSSVVLKYVALNTWRIIADFASGTGFSREMIQDIVGLMVSGNTETNIAVTYDDAAGKLNFVVNDANTVPTPSIHNFVIGVPSRVDPGTDITGNTSVSFDISNHSQLSAISLIVTSGDNKTLTVPVTDGLQTQPVTLTGIDTSSGTSVTFTLSGTVFGTGATVTSNTVTVQIAALQDHEQVHFGHVTQATEIGGIDFTTNDIGTAEQTAGNYTVIGIPSNGLHRIYFAIPTAFDDVVSITQGGFNLTEQFAETSSQTIGGQTYEIWLMVSGSAVNDTYNNTILTLGV